LVVAGLEIDDAELVLDELAFVVGVEDGDLGDRAGQIGGEDGVEEVDEQGTVALRTQSVGP
jgi:hypothetical protein